VATFVLILAIAGPIGARIADRARTAPSSA
jgi:hypothetical protein